MQIQDFVFFGVRVIKVWFRCLGKDAELRKVRTESMTSSPIKFQ